MSTYPFWALYIDKQLKMHGPQYLEAENSDDAKIAVEKEFNSNYGGQSNWMVFTNISEAQAIAKSWDFLKFVVQSARK